MAFDPGPPKRIDIIIQEVVIISRIDFSTIPPFYHLLCLFILVIQNIRRSLNKGNGESNCIESESFSV